MAQFRRGRIGVSPALAAGFALVLAAALVGCGDDEPVEPAAASTAAEPSQQPSAAASPDAPDAPAEATDEPDASAEASSNTPDGFPDIGLPIYSPAEQMTMNIDSDELYLLEYVTDHELTIVNMFFADRLVEGPWHDVSRSVDGQTTVTTATRDGYSLVVAVLPDRVDDTRTTIHYTIRPLS